MYARFAELHRSGCFVMPNPWDAGSLACSCASASRPWPRPARVGRGLAGGPTTRLTVEAALAHLREMAAVVAGAGEWRLRGRLRGPAGGRCRQRGQRRDDGCGGALNRRLHRGRGPTALRLRARGRTRARRAPRAGHGQVQRAAHRPLRRLHRRPARAGGDAAPARGLRGRRVRTVCTPPASARGPRLARSCGRYRRSQSTSWSAGTSRRWRTSPPLGVRRISVGGALARAAWTGFLAGGPRDCRRRHDSPGWDRPSRSRTSTPCSRANEALERSIAGTRRRSASDRRVIAST